MRSNIDLTLREPPPKRKLPPHPIRCLLAVALLCLSGCAGTVRVKDTTRSFDTVVIDAGHGGYDDGARSRWGGREKHHALDVARHLENRLRAVGLNTVMTRRSDTFVPLERRAAISNRQRNAVFVSVHFNHSRRRAIRGTEVYYKSGVSQPVARRILGKIGALPGASPRFVRTANFRVLRLNEYPAVLVECGYLSHRREGARCASQAHRVRLAQAIAGALIEQRGWRAPHVVPPSGGTNPSTITTVENQPDRSIRR